MSFYQQSAKLTDCHQHDANAELFIVEGDSAALAVTHLCNAHHQAVLAMQGKPMNTLRVSKEKLMDNVIFSHLIDAIGAGVGDGFDLEGARYQRIILLMDPDADGIHCGALMLMFFYQWMKPLLANERILMARPPVGEFFNPQTNEKKYTQTPTQYFEQLRQNEVKGNDEIQTLKYRGLAGIPHDVLVRNCIDLETRVTGAMRLKDAEMAIKVFSPGH